MARRRMISLDVIDTDLFIDMPVTSRLLYYELCIRADDDGFVGSPKKIQSIVKCSDDDFKVLITKNFIIPFENGVIVIRDWKVHNYIPKDRYKPTIYQKEMKLLNIDCNGSYSIDSEICTQPVYKLDTQVRLGKDRLGKDREEEKEDPSASSDILKMYGDNIHPVSSPVEAEKLKTLVDTHGETFVAKAIERAVMRNKRSLAYITGILNNWEANGYDEGIEGKRTEKQSDPERSADLERFMREREEHKKKQRRF